MSPAPDPLRYLRVPIRFWWRLTVIEVLGFVAIARGIARRPDVPDGATAIPYARGRWAAPAMFGFAALAELIALDLLVPWERLGRYSGLRWVALLLGVYGALWVVMYVVGQRMYPHLLRAEELVVRNSHVRIMRIPRSALRDARVRPLRDTEEDRVVMSDPLAPANLDLDFSRSLPIYGWLGGVTKHAERVALIVDDPQETAARLRTWALSDAASDTDAATNRHTGW